MLSLLSKIKIQYFVDSFYRIEQRFSTWGREVSLTGREDFSETIC